MKKGYCIYCNKHDEQRRIFDVNSDSRYCYCPHCGHKYRPRIAIFNYERVINKYLRHAYFYLKNAGEPLLAYNLFAYVLELEPTNKTAKLGRLLSLCYLSTLRKNRFLETKEMLNICKDEYHNKTMKDEYIAFLLSLNHCIDDYLTRLRKKLSFKEYFYDVDCAKLYFLHFNEGMDLKRMIAEELSLIEAERHSGRVYKSISEFEKELTESFYTVDGQERRLLNYAKSGEPLIANGKKKEDLSKYERYRMCTLDPNNKKLRVLKEPVFSTANSKMYKFFRVSFMFFILLFAAAIALLIVYLIYMAAKYSVILLVLALILGVGSLTFFALRVIFSIRLKKPRQ